MFTTYCDNWIYAGSVIDLPPMDMDAIRQEARDAANRAADSRLIKMSQVAERIGWSQSMLVTFRKDGDGAIEKVIELHRVLR